MPSQLSDQLKRAVSYSGLLPVARKLNVQPVTLAILLLTPERSQVTTRRRVRKAAERADLSDLLPPSIEASA